MATPGPGAPRAVNVKAGDFDVNVTRITTTVVDENTKNGYAAQMVNCWPLGSGHIFCPGSSHV